MQTQRFVFAAALLASTTLTFAAADMKTMDSNSDGMVSKQEFLSYHEAMFDKMDKGGKGMVAVRDVDMSMRGHMMRGDKAARTEKAKSDQSARTGEGVNSSPAPK